MKTETATLTAPAACAAPVEPSILTANTYFWTPASVADCRRRNEARRIGEVADYFRVLGMTITSQGERHVSARLGEVEVTFSYEETCRNVYKALRVTRAGKNSNVTALRRIAAQGA